MPAIVVPAGVVTVSRSSAGCIFLSLKRLAVPVRVFVTSLNETSLGIPTLRPALTIASITTAMYAGPLPLRAVMGFKSDSGTFTKSPKHPRMNSTLAASAGVTLVPREYAVMASSMTAAMFGIDLTTFAWGRALSSLSMVIAAIRDMTILLTVNFEISLSTSFASPALTDTSMRSAFFAASLLSDVTKTFPGRARASVEMSLLVIITLETLLDLAIEVATASPILPAPITVTIKARGALPSFGLITSLRAAGERRN